MRPDDILQLLRRQPFQPFRIYLSTGIIHEIHHPELALVGRSTVTLEFAPSGAPVPLAERVVIVALLHIVQVERIRPTPSPSVN